MRNSINFLSNFVRYYNSLSILKKFLIPSLLGFMFFMLFYIYILSNTTYMKEKIHEINTQTIPLYETIFDNEFLLQKISHELQSAVAADELELIKDTDIYANKFKENLEEIKKSSSTNKLFHIENAFNDYYIEASNLAKDMIIDKSNYNYLYKKTQVVVHKYNKLLNLFQEARKDIKEEIKNNVSSVYLVSNEILFRSTLAFVLWMILSILGLLYVYKDMKSRIRQIVEQSEKIASGKANFHRRLTSKSSDELGLVVNSINTFISKLEKNHHQLEDARDDIKRFIADTVHQIRTPLSSILMNAEMIRDSQEDDSLTEFIDSIDASINMLSNSYEDLSYVTSYDSIQYKPNVLSLSNLVNKRIDFFGTICKMNLKVIEADIQKEIETFINIVECERIIDNNIANAIKYADIEKPIYISLLKHYTSNKIILEFRSFAKEIKDKDKIFEKNYREEDSKRGLGLGLNIVKSICDKYNILYKASYENNQNVFTYIFEEI